MTAYLTKAGNLSGLTDFATARDNLNLGTLNTPVFAGVQIQGSGLNVSNLTPTSLSMNHTGFGSFVIQPSSGITFPNGTTQTTAFTTALLSGYATESWVTSQGYITSSALVPYLLSSTAASTYQPISGMSSYLTTSAAASTYAVTARGLPAAGTTGQVLTKNSGSDYDVSFATLIPGDRYLTTSTTSNTIGNGTKTFTVGTGLSYSSQQDVVISFDAANHMHGLVTSYNSGTGVLVVDVQHKSGSGTYSVWTVNVGGMVPQASIVWGDITGTLGNQTDLSTALNAKLESSTAASTYAPIASPTFTGTVTIPAGASISGFAPLASPALTGNVTINSNSTGAALFIEQLGTGNILTLHDQATDTNFVAIDANGKFNTVPSEATNGAGFNIPHGTAPTTPVNGDIWTTTGGIFWRQNGSTQQAADVGSTQTISGNKTFSNANVSFGTSTAAGTINVGTGATISGSTKAVNIGTAGASGSTTNVTIGSSVAGSGVNVTVNGVLTTTGATQTIGNSTAASTVNIGTGATISGSTKTVNIGTSGATGSTTVVNIANNISGPSGASTINIGTATPSSNVVLNGNVTTTTQAADTNNTSLATTAYVVGQAGSATPLVNGTAAVGTSLRYARQDHVHPTDTSRAALASPTFTGVPAAPTAAVDTNTTQLATTAFVVAQAAAATPLVNGTAAVGTSTRYARADHVHPTDTTRAPLASPAFTGTPSLPTGTTAVTQSAGNNTTAVATTAFVQQEVPAASTTAAGKVELATVDEALRPVSSTLGMTPDTTREMLMYPGYINLFGGGNVATSGAGASSTFTFASQRWHAMRSPNAATAGYGMYIFDYSTMGIGMAAMTRGSSSIARKWNNRIWVSGRTVLAQFGEATSGFNGDANCTARVMLGGRSSAGTGGMQSTDAGIGWRVAGGGSVALVMTVSNGTTLTETTSSFTPVLGEVFDWKMYSDGTGNVTLWVNDSQVATSTGGPTTSTAENYNFYCEVVEQTASAATPFSMGCFGSKVFWSQA
jgi:hypothetical protein